MSHSEAHALQATTEIAKGEHESANTSVRRAMVVDDDADTRQVLISWLRARHYQVVEVESGEAAIERLEHDAPDLLFLDVLMPGLSGLQVLEHVREQLQDTAIILVTAFGSEQVAITALRRGADDYLHKPFTTREFQSVLERNVSRLELRRQNQALQQQLDDKRRQLEAELARAARVQADLAPRQLPELPGYDVAAACIPAREVGGDFYDWFMPTPDRLSLSLGDVMGKGMPAALLMTAVRATLRAVAYHASPLRNLQAAINALAPDFDRAETFVTLFHAQLLPETGQLTFVDAGHGASLLITRQQQLIELGHTGAPIGLDNDMPYTEQHIQLRPGDMFLLFSDGLLEVFPEIMNPDLTILGPMITQSNSAQDLVERILARGMLKGHPPDDMTVIVLQRHAYRDPE